MRKRKLIIFWFRRDLRIEDNKALSDALQRNIPVLPLFIFDSNIIDELETDDPRITFIYEQLERLSNVFKSFSSSIYVHRGVPEMVWTALLNEFDIEAVYANEDYEPYGIQRDAKIKELLEEKHVDFHLRKDHVIFAKGEVLKPDNSPYTIYTPYRNRWLNQFEASLHLEQNPINTKAFYKCQIEFPQIETVGFVKSTIKVQPYSLTGLNDYKINRDYPAKDRTSYLSPHLRFGTVSIRQIFKQSLENQQFIYELIWREFFMQILYHFPQVVCANFKPKYDSVAWRNKQSEFEKWKNGTTGYPIVDAGMRQLNATGYMHNRVRMITASFLCKHLLIDWRWGETYFASKLLDYELASNNGNWQWVAGTGCDAAPYFRVFNPTEQVKKFDTELSYIRKWVTELDTLEYPPPMVDHKLARERAIETYKKGIQGHNE